MMAIGNLSRYAGLDSVLGLEFAHADGGIRSLARCSAGSASR